MPLPALYQMQVFRSLPDARHSTAGAAARVLRDQHRGEKQRQLPVGGGDAPACSLPDALHSVLPLRLLLGVHSQEERNRAGVPDPLDHGSPGVPQIPPPLLPRGQLYKDGGMKHTVSDTNQTQI